MNSSLDRVTRNTNVPTAFPIVLQAPASQDFLLQDGKCHAIATLALHALETFFTAPKVHPNVHAPIESAMDAIADKTFHPRHSGEILFVTGEIRQGVKALKEMQEKIESLPKEDLERSGLEASRDRLFEEFVYYLTEWSEIAVDSMEKEISLLWKEIKKQPKDDTQSRIDGLRQLQSLRNKQEKVCRTVEACAAKTINLPDLHQCLEEAAVSIRNLQRDVDQKLAAHQTKIPLVPLIYGSKEWLQLEKRRPQTIRSPFAELLHTLTHPQKWSDTVKATVHSLFLGMQISQAAIHFTRQLGQGEELKQQAEFLRRQMESMRNEILPEQKKTIERDAAMLGTLLGDKYEAIRRNPELIEKFCAGNDRLQNSLKQALREFGENAPSSKDQRRFLDAFQLEGYAGRPSSPFSHLSLSQWWALFTKPEEASATSFAESADRNTAPFQYEVVTSSASNQLPWIRRLIDTVGNLFTKAPVYKNQGLDVPTLMIEEELTRITAALADLREIKVTQPDNESNRQRFQFLEQNLQRLTHTSMPANQFEWFSEVYRALDDVSVLKREITKKSVGTAAYTKMKELKRFIESSPIAIDDKWLLHVVGDFFGNGTTLEGASRVKAQKYLHAILGRKIEILREVRNASCNLITGVCDAFGISKDKTFEASLSDEEYTTSRLLTHIETAMRIETASTKKRYQGFAEELRTTLTSLTSGESAFFTLVWTGLRASGHVMYLEFIRQKDGRYAMRAYNSGKGLSYHAKSEAEFQKKYITFVEKVNIPLENILKRPILKAFDELRNENVEWTENDVYLNVLDAIGGEINPLAGAGTNVFFKQRAGTCVHMSLLTTLSHHLPDLAAHKKLHFEIRFKAVHDYFRLHQARLNTDVRSRNLLKKSIEEMGRVVKAIFDDGILNEFEFSYALDKINEIDANLKMAEKRYLAQLANRAPVVSFSPDNQAMSAKAIRLSTPIDLEAPVQSNPMIYHPRTLHTWSPKAETLATDLDHHLSEFKKAWKDRDYTFIVRNFEQLVERLPIEWITAKDTMIWERVSEVQKMEAIHALNLLSRFSYDSLLRHCKTQSDDCMLVTQRFMLAHLKALTLAHQLLASSSSSATCPLEIFKPSEEVFKLFDSRGYFRVYHPRLDNEIRSIDEYWQKQEKGRSIAEYFSFESYDNFLFYYEDAPVENWAKSVMDQSKVDQILENYPDLFSPEREGVVFALADRVVLPRGTIHQSKRDLLPQYYYDLSDLSITLEALERLPIVPSMQLGNEVLRPEKQVKFASQNVPIYQVINSVKFKGLTLDGFDWEAYKSDVSEPSSAAAFYVLSGSPHSKRAHKQLRNDSLKRIYENEVFSPFGLAPEDRLILLTETLREGGLTLQKERALRRLFFESSLKIKETLGYFMGNPSLLEDPDFQTLFQLLFFEPGLLLNELRLPKPDAEVFVDKLATFLSTQFHIYKELQQFETAAFFLHINELCQRYVHYAFAENSTVDQAMSHTYGFLDSAKETRALLQLENLNLGQRALLHQQLILCYQGKRHLTTSEIGEVLASAAYRKVQPPPFPYAERQKEIVVDQILHELAEEIKSALAGIERDAILNGVVEKCFGGPALHQWKMDPEFPKFISSNREFSINCLTGTVEQGGRVLTTLPGEIVSNPLMKEVFVEDLPKIVSRDEFGIYSFSYQGANYRLRLIEEVLTIQREFMQNDEKRWYELVPKKTLRDQLALSALYNGVLTGWHTAGHKPHIIFADIGTNQQRYRLDTTKSNVTVYQLDSNGQESDLILSDVINQNSPWHFLTHFEHPGDILVWKNKKTKIPEKIEFPRFGNKGLAFNIGKHDGSLMAISEDYHGYYLAQKQLVPALKDFPHFLLLENSSGQQKVLLPCQRIVRDVSEKELIGSLDSTKMHLERQLLASERTLEYEVDRQSGVLKPVTEEARLYLALLHLWKMDYSQAMTLLEGYRSYLRPYTEQEIEILSWIIFSQMESSDHDPRALSLILYASYLMIKHARDFQLLPPELPNLQSQYELYLDQLNNIHGVRLKPAEELVLLDFSSNSAVLDRRRQALQLDAEKKQNEKLTFTWSAQVAQARRSGFNQTVAEFVKQCNLRNSETKPSLILRPYLTPHFPEAYAMLKGERDAESVKQIYEKLTGLKLINGDLNACKEELALAFKMMKRIPTDIQEQMVVRILDAVLRYPDLFPPSYNLHNAFKSNRWVDFKKREKVIQDLLIITADIEEDMNDFFEDDRFYALPLNIPSPLTRANQITELPLPYLISLATTTPPDSLFSKIHPERVGIKSMCLTSDSIPLVSPRSLASLQSSFKLKSADQVIFNEFDRVQKSIGAYADLLSNQGKNGFEIADLQKFKRSAHEIREHALDAHKQKQALEASLLALANKPSAKAVEERRAQALAIGEGKEPLTIDSLIQLFWRRDGVLMFQKNPNLTPHDCVELQQGMAKYLFLATHQQYLSRIATKMEEIIVSVVEKEPPAQTSELIQQFYRNAHAERVYDVNVHPEYLVLEYYLDLRIRQDQANMLDLLEIKDGKAGNPQKLGVVIEMIMGAGKTSVLLPLLALFNADGDNLSMVVMPETLMPSMSQELARLQGRGFSQSVQVMTFDRETKVDTESLKWILQRLHAIREGKQVLLITSSSIQSLYLKYVELIYLYSEAITPSAIAALDEQLLLMGQVFGLFKEKGLLVIDEADIIFNARKEHHFTLGAPLPLDADEAGLIGILYELLATDPMIRKLMKFDFVEFKEGKPFSPEKYTREIVPLLIDALMQRRLGTENSDVKRFFDTLSPDNYALVKDYLSNSKETKVIDFVSNNPSLKVKNLLALGREEIHTLLKLTLGKLSNVHYGYSPKAATLAIPYHGSNNPAVRSQFGNPYETWNYTLQLALKYGISRKVFEKEILKMRTHAMQELKDDPKKTLADTVAGKLYSELTLNDRQLSLFGPDKQIDLLLAKMNADPKRIIHFAQQHIAPEILNYPYMLNANPQIFNFLFKRVLGFTGTQWNADTFPQDLQSVPDQLITGITLSILWQNSHDAVYTISKVDSSALAARLIESHPELQKAHALIDTAGMARGVDNEEIARQLLSLPTFQQRNPPIQGVAFYDKNENLVILEKRKKPIPLENSSLKKEERFTFYDQKHITGSNIPQIAVAVGVVTVGKHTILRDLLQSVWRMRGVDKSHRIKFIVSDEDSEFMRSALETLLSKEVSAPLTLEHILLYVTYNQALLQGDNNYRSLKHKMYALLQAEFINAVVSGSIPGADLQAQFKKVKDLFLTESSHTPWELFGIPQELVSSQTVVDNDVSRLVNSLPYQAMTEHPAFAKRLETFKERFLALVKKSSALLTTHMLSALRYGKETEREAEKEKEKEAELPSLAKTKYEYRRIPLDEARDHLFDFNYYKESYWLGSSPFRKIPIPGCDAGLLGSVNLINQEVLDKPFSSNQKPVDDALVLQNQKTGELKIVLLDQADTVQFRNFLLENYKEPNFVDRLWISPTRAGLYNFQLGLYLQGKERFDMDALLKNPQFLKLISQAKFFNGETFYTDAELLYLKKWIEDQGVEKMYTLFRNEVLKWKEDSLEQFPNSPIGKLFTTLGISYTLRNSKTNL